MPIAELARRKWREPDPIEAIEKSIPQTGGSGRSGGHLCGTHSGRGRISRPAAGVPSRLALCDRHGILLVVDEIQSGMGRTGKMYAIEHWGVEPDIICLAEGIASGLPLGAIVARAQLMDWPPGSHASTFGGNPVACAAALETIALWKKS